MVIADDRAIRRSALATLLTQEGFTIAGEADGPAAIEHRLRSRPHLLLLTPAAAGDLDIIRRIHERHAITRILMLTEGSPHEDLSSYIVAGAQGVVSERETDRTLLRAIPVVLRGEIWAGRKIVARAIERLVATARASVGAEPSARARLTGGELAVAELVAQGRRNEEIARQLGRSERTVRNHLTRIFRKLGCRNRVTLATLLLRQPDTARDRSEVASPHEWSVRPVEPGNDPAPRAGSPGGRERKL